MKIRPTDIKIKKEIEEGFNGSFIIEPLPQGFGHTIGNSLRRVLLTSLEGAAISYVKFNGVAHQFTTIKGVKEDVVELTLNLKGLRVKVHGEGPFVMKLSKKGPGVVTAGDFEVTSDIEIANKDLHIATLADKDAVLDIEATVERGIGYVPAEEKETNKVGSVLLDSIYSPVYAVSYSVAPTRVGRESNLDKLTINIQTDGTISPYDALSKASDILREFFGGLSGYSEDSISEDTLTPVATIGKSANSEEVYLEELPLPTRTINALKKAGIKTLSELAAKSAEELAEVKNLGEKSVEDIKKLLEEERSK